MSENLAPQQNKLDIAPRLAISNELNPTLPVLSRFVALREAKHILDVEQLGHVAAVQRVGVQPCRGDCGVGPEHYALAAPTIPVEERVDAAQHLRREGPGRCEQVEVLQDRGANLLVSPAKAGRAERLFHAAKTSHLVRHHIAHAATARRFIHTMYLLRGVPHSSAAPAPVQRTGTIRSPTV